MNRIEANRLGREITSAFIKGYEKLILEGYHDNARAVFLTAFPFALATVPPENRVYAVADLLEMYSTVGAEMYEDGADLYDALTKRGESLE